MTLDTQKQDLCEERIIALHKGLMSDNEFAKYDGDSDFDRTRESFEAIADKMVDVLYEMENQETASLSHAEHVLQQFRLMLEEAEKFANYAALPKRDPKSAPISIKDKVYLLVLERMAMRHFPIGGSSLETVPTESEINDLIAEYRKRACFDTNA